MMLFLMQHNMNNIMHRDQRSFHSPSFKPQQATYLEYEQETTCLSVYKPGNQLYLKRENKFTPK